LVESSGAFYLAMNTRLQVEHPVAEAVTGLDLVALQIRIAQGAPPGIAQGAPPGIAQGAPPGIAQGDFALSGHAIDARLHAEDPGQGGGPSAGPVALWRPPGAHRADAGIAAHRADVGIAAHRADAGIAAHRADAGIAAHRADAGIAVHRVDAGIAAGGEVSARHDPMVAKPIARAPTREEARRRLIAALRGTAPIGPYSGAAFLIELFEASDFSAGRATADWLVARWPGRRAPRSCARAASFAGPAPRRGAARRAARARGA
jgi:acetyl/propionyl-CoA carboxylase alpha subunit